MEFKGTKGKWVIKKSSNTTNLWIKGDVPVCTIYSGTKEEEYADALLISKAPELLEMLKGIYQMGIGAVLSEQHIEAIEQLIKESTDLQTTS